MNGDDPACEICVFDGFKPDRLHQPDKLFLVEKFRYRAGQIGIGRPRTADRAADQWQCVENTD